MTYEESKKLTNIELKNLTDDQLREVIAVHMQELDRLNKERDRDIQKVFHIRHQIALLGGDQ